MTRKKWVKAFEEVTGLRLVYCCPTSDYSQLEISSESYYTLYIVNKTETKYSKTHLELAIEEYKDMERCLNFWSEKDKKKAEANDERL